MAIIITPQEEITKYYAYPALQQSRLKLLIESTLHKFNSYSGNQEKEFEDNTAFNIGGGVDTWLTSSEEEFRKQYHASKVSKPSDNIMIMLNRVFDLLVKEFSSIEGEVLPDTEAKVKTAVLKDYNHYLLLALDEQKYQLRWGEEKRIEALLKHEEYFKDLQTAYGKQILSVEEYDTISAICKSLIENPVTSKYFDKKIQAGLPHIDFYYQLPIYFKHRGVDCKALLDFCLVFKTPEGKIFKVVPLDLKTTRFSTLSFPIAVKQRRYDIQAVWYDIAIKEWLKGQDIHEDLSVEPFKFIVETTMYNGQGNPLIFKVSDELYEIGLNGRTAITVGLFNPENNIQNFDMEDKICSQVVLKPRILGVNQLMDIYLYHVQNGFQKEKVLLETQGPLTLDWENDYREEYFR